MLTRSELEVILMFLFCCKITYQFFTTHFVLENSTMTCRQINIYLDRTVLTVTLHKIIDGERK
jgi:hypothetical protein